MRRQEGVGSAAGASYHDCTRPFPESRRHFRSASALCPRRRGTLRKMCGSCRRVSAASAVGRRGGARRMNVITVSREYGAGGGEAARQLGEALGWEVLDRELLHRAAAIEHVPDAEIERLDEQAIRLLDRLSFHPAHKR